MLSVIEMEGKDVATLHSSETRDWLQVEQGGWRQSDAFREIIFLMPFISRWNLTFK